MNTTPTTSSFSRAHISTLLKYLGVSFITGAIAHGFFSESREIITGGIGVISFIIGTFLESTERQPLRILVLSALLAVSIGMVTGGLQHFPDSPSRSVWILPLGIILSLLFFCFSRPRTGISRDILLYSGILSLIGLMGSWGLYTFFSTHPIREADHHQVTNEKSPHTAPMTLAERCQTMPEMPECKTDTDTHSSHDMMAMSMSDMSEMLQGKTGDALDRAFLEGMIPHHQGAVDMAQFLSGAKHPELREMGKTIIEAQTQEINQMKQWMQAWGYSTGSTHH